MFILRFYHYLMGYYLVEIKGLNPEKIINLLKMIHLLCFHNLLLESAPSFFSL